MVASPRWGLTLPLPGIGLADLRTVLSEAERLGYTDAWTSEADYGDAFTPLAVAACCTERMRLGTGIANTFTRGPATLAVSAFSLGDAAPGRFVLGIGSSSDTIVRDWNGLVFRRPLQHTREVLLLLREALSGARVARSYDTASMQGFRLIHPPVAPIPIYLAAQREGMLRLAGELADGVLLNWLTPDNVPTAVRIAREAAAASGRDPAALEVVCRIFVIAHEDRELAYTAARRFIAGYLNVPVYRAFHEWMGNAALFQPMWERWQAGDRRGALAAISDDAIDQVVGVGDAGRCRTFVERYREQGVDTPVIAFLPPKSLLAPSEDLVGQGAETLAMLRALGR
jgi:probable F420-dependent oxidoreductase